MKNLHAAYMAHKFAKGGRVKPTRMDMQMCAHGGPTMCAEGCYAEGGSVKGSLSEDLKSPIGGRHMESGIEEYMPKDSHQSNPKLTESKKMAYGGLTEYGEETEEPEENIDLSGDLDAEMPDENYVLDNQIGAGYENDEDDDKSMSLLSKILGRLKQRHTQG